MRIARLVILISIFVLISDGAWAQTIKSIRRASLAPGTNAQGKAFSYDPRIDGAGTQVIFTSASDNFAAPGNVAGEFHEHLYLRNLQGGFTSQLDLTPDGRTGSPGAAFLPDTRVFHSSFNAHISRNGRWAVFQTSESDIATSGPSNQFGQWAYLRDLVTGETKRIPHVFEGDQSKGEYPAYLAINADGSVVVVISIMSEISDTTCQNCPWELTVYDALSNTTRFVQTGVTGNKFNPALSDDGRFVVFENQPGDFSAPTYSYLYDLQLEELTSLNNGAPAKSPAISGDGTIIAYADTSSYSGRIRLRDRVTGIETLVSGGMNGAEPTGMSEFPALSLDGRYVAFLSSADNLVPKDTNGTDDIFVFDRITGNTTLVSVQGACPGVVTREEFNTGPPSISSDGTTIAFAVLERLLPADLKDSSGAVIEPADSNRFDDVYFVTLDYAAQPSVFAKGLKPAAPLVSVNCTGAEANIRVEDILAKKPGITGIPKRSAQIKSVTQQVVIQSSDPGAGKRQFISKISSRRNEVTNRNLPPGNYTARVTAEAKYKDGKVIKSRISPSSSFTITK